MINRLQPLFALAIRIYVAQVFFRSGLIKLSNWQSTLALFANEYHVPVLPPNLAAILGTTAEVGLPVLLGLGLGTRFAAIALFVFNIVAAASYPDLSPPGSRITSSGAR
jgi:putative oxidoreductase